MSLNNSRLKTKDMTIHPSAKSRKIASFGFVTITQKFRVKHKQWNPHFLKIYFTADALLS